MKRINLGLVPEHFTSNLKSVPLLNIK